MMRIVIAIVIMALLSSVPLHAATLEEESQIGKSTDLLVRRAFHVYDDQKVQRYVRGVGQRLIDGIQHPLFEYRFTVLDHPMLNAFALPGGYIYITTGMLAYIDSEAALASILGHEVGHSIGHHTIKKMKEAMGDQLLVLAGMAAAAVTGGASGAAAMMSASAQLSQLRQLGYGRSLEMQADELGLIYSYDAGYDPRQGSQLFRTLRFKDRVSGVAYHGFVSTHPDTVKRIIQSEYKAEILYDRGGGNILRREEYIEAMAGLTYGKYNRRIGEHAPYKLIAHKVKKGETFRQIAKEQTGDERMAFEIAVMNGKKPDFKVEAGMLLKVPTPLRK